MGKIPCSFCRSSSRRRPKKAAQSLLSPLPQPPPQTGVCSPPINNNGSGLVGSGGGGAMGKVKKKAGGARLWMRLDRWGQTELIEWDKSAIIRRAAIPARDLRILGPVFSQSSNILGKFIFYSAISFELWVYSVEVLFVAYLCILLPISTTSNVGESLEAKQLVFFL